MAFGPIIRGCKNQKTCFFGFKNVKNSNAASKYFFLKCVIPSMRSKMHVALKSTFNSIYKKWKNGIRHNPIVATGCLFSCPYEIMSGLATSSFGLSNSTTQIIRAVARIPQKSNAGLKQCGAPVACRNWTPHVSVAFLKGVLSVPVGCLPSEAVPQG